MARYVRCIEGHVFNAQASAACPKCGASISQPASDPPKDPKEGPRIERKAPGSGRTTPGVWQLVARRPRAAAALLALVGYIAYTQWPDVSDWLYWEFVAEDPAQTPADTQPSKAAVAPHLASQEPPSEEDIAQASLSDEHRAAINREYAALAKFLQAERQINYAADASLPWSPETKLAMLRDDAAKVDVDADVKSAAEQGRWSEDAIAMAELLGGYASLQQGGVAAAVTQFETAVRLGLPMALLYVGMLHRTCELKDPVCDNDAGYRWLRLSAERGNANAAFKTAIFFSADSTEEERADAVRFFRIALEHGDPEAMDLARRAGDGDRAAKDELAEYSIKPDEVPLSTGTLFNQRTRSDPAQVAVKLLQRAQAGDNVAMMALAAMAHGNEILSLPQASQAELVRESARRGNLHAIFRLGDDLVAAAPGAQNFSEAALWFAAATTFSEKGSDNQKEAAKRYAGAVGKLPEEQRATLATLIKRIAPQVSAGRL